MNDLAPTRPGLTEREEEYARLLIAEHDTALTIELVRRLMPDDVSKLVAIFRHRFSPSELANLLHVVSDEVQSMLGYVDAEDDEEGA